MNLQGRSLVKDVDLTAEEFGYLLDLAAQLRLEKRMGQRTSKLLGRNIALIFEKASTRTRCAFEVAAHDEGAHVTYLGPGESQLGFKESVRDTARVLGRMFDGIEYRGPAQQAVETLAAYAGVPVWNGLTDALLGMDVRICAPAPLQPPAGVREMARRLAAGSGARLTVTADTGPAVAGADYLYTDVWLSMGEPEDHWDERIDLLLPYQVTADLMAATGNQAVRFMHCLPALHDTQTMIGERLFRRRGLGALEVTDEVFSSPASIVFDQAENRLHTIKALMVATIGETQ